MADRQLGSWATRWAGGGGGLGHWPHRSEGPTDPTGTQASRCRRPVLTSAKTSRMLLRTPGWKDPSRCSMCSSSSCRVFTCGSRPWSAARRGRSREVGQWVGARKGAGHTVQHQPAHEPAQAASPRPPAAAAAPRGSPQLGGRTRAQQQWQASRARVHMPHHASGGVWSARPSPHLVGPRLPRRLEALPGAPPLTVLCRHRVGDQGADRGTQPGR